MHWIGLDASLLGRNRTPRRFSAGESLTDADGSPVHLFISGEVHLSAETPFGPHEVAILPAPILLDLRTALGGTPGVCRLLPSADCEAVVFDAAEARLLLFEPFSDGPAFRRLALASLAAALRETNASLGGFFDGPAAPDRRAAEAAPLSTPDARAVDPAKAGDLFDAAGLDPSLLPALGLSALGIPEGGLLMRAGAAGDEAYLLAEGRLRVWVDIAGAGEEALAILSAGEIVGEMSLVDDAPRSANVTAHGGPALVYVLSRDVLRRLLDLGDPEGASLLAGIAIVLTRRLEEALRKAATFRILAGPP